MVPLNLFPLVNTGSYRQLFSCHNTVKLEPAEARFESAEWAVSYGKNRTKEKVLRKVSDNVVLNARLRTFRLDTCNAKKGKPRDILSQLLVYQKLISRFCVE